ncbi:MAG TPA: hypothetical protein VEA99_00060 [Gemmatimonadaceae bacterium]|nr:hypothetical protein [Gemmatimonadaceae bacterium]
METRQRYRNTIAFTVLSAFLFGSNAATALLGLSGFADDASAELRILSVILLALFALQLVLAVRELLRFSVEGAPEGAPPAV